MNHNTTLNDLLTVSIQFGVEMYSRYIGGVILAGWCRWCWFLVVGLSYLTIEWRFGRAAKWVGATAFAIDCDVNSGIQLDGGEMDTHREQDPVPQALVSSHLFALVQIESLHNSHRDK